MCTSGKFLLLVVAMLMPAMPVLAQDIGKAFNFNLFNAVAKGSTQNVVISPLSAYIALSMALNGAVGSTREQMAQALGITGDTVGQLNERERAVLTALNGNDKVQLKIANAIFVNKNTPIKSSFIDLCKHIYDAQAECLDFKNSNVLTSINAWCNSKTEGKIPAIIDSLSASEKIVILNAVYFKGEWANAFKKTDTQDDKFITASGDITDVKMMHQRQQLFYFKGETFKAVSIPYAGGQQSLYIFLPNKKVDLSLLQAQFTEKNWHDWMSSFHNMDVNLSLPKFTVNSCQDLSSNLKVLGMAEAFDPQRADFSHLVYFGYKAWISRVLQKTYIDVDEQGTEAAAATAIVMATLSVPAVRPQAIEFRVDHPFILALVDNDSKEILFLGTIVKP